MSSFYLEEVKKIGDFIQEIQEIEKATGVAILCANNEIWIDGDCVAKVDYDDNGNLKVYPYDPNTTVNR